MNRKKIVSLFVVSLMLIGFIVFPLSGNINVYAGNTITNAKATKILKAVNPHIVSYDVKTHKVTYDNGDFVFVTPPNGKVRNGDDESWKHFIKDRGKIFVVTKHNIAWLIEKKNAILKERGIPTQVNLFANMNNYYSYTTSGEVYVSQYPQKYCTWCGPAATQSAISGWYYRGIGILPPQEDIATTEFRYDGNPVPHDCSGSGVSFNAICYALNGYIFAHWSSDYWYRVLHFYNKDQFKSIVQFDIGYSAPVIFCGNTEYLPAWNHHHAVHYTTVYGFDFSVGTISYTDSADGLSWHSHIPPKNTVTVDEYYNYAKDYAAAG